MATALTSNYNLSANSNNNNSSTSNISYTSTSTNGYHDNNHANNATSNNYHNNNSQSLSTSSALSSTMSTTANNAVAASSAYRVGEYVYVEISPSSPYLVCKIEELIKTQNGNYEVKLIVFYRRRDMSLALIQQSICALQEEQEKEYEQFSEKEKHQIKLRELFLSRQIETYPTSSIKGKCQVALLCEWESLRYYLKREDTFFYTQVYDPEQKNITEAERGEIRVGLRYQAEVPAQPLEDPMKEDTRRSEDLETLVFTPDHNMTESEIEKYLVMAKSIGTYARALDCSSSVKQPSLLASASLASRDITIQHAMDILHECNYDLSKAVCRLVPKSGPVLCRDEMEEWSATEASYFDEAIDKCEKKFEEIRQNYLPWKCMKNLIEYYYFWKTTDRYVQRKRVKVVENENKLKQVFISNHNILSPTISGDELNGSKCASCKKTSSSNWHVWGVSNMQYFLCQSCWSFWRKFGAFKYPNRFADLNAEKLQIATANYSNQINNANVRTAPVNDLNPSIQQQSFACRDCNRTFHRQDRLLQHMASHRPFKCTTCGKEFKFKNQLQKHCSNSHGMAMRSGSPRPIMKTRAAFYFNAVPALKFARNICSDILNLKRAARRPHAINIAQFKQEYSERLEKGNTRVPKLKTIDRGKVVDISHRLGTPKMPKPEWLIATPKNKLPHPERLAFPPSKKEEPEDITDHNSKDFSETNRKRPLEHNGNIIPSKRRQMAPPSILGKSVPDLYENISRNSVSTQSLNGRAKIATITNLSGKKQMISWVDAPDDVFFVCTKKIKQLRRRIPLPELLRAARQPYKLHYDHLLMQANSSSSSSSSSSQALPNVAANRSSAQTSAQSIPVNKMNPVHNQAANAAALNLAGITSSLSAQPQLPQQVAALFQQQMLSLPLLGPNANHLVSSNPFFSGLTPPTNNSTSSNTGTNKSNR